MAKDPAFLFYSKDWLEGTAEFLPEEKGVYIDLLSHQHQKGDLPIDLNRLCRIVGLDILTFERIWKTVSDKFIIIDERFINEKLSQVMSERSSKAIKNKLIGTFGYCLKKLHFSKKEEKLLKSKFNVNKMLQLSSEWDSERLSEWCQNAIAIVEDEDANENKSLSLLNNIELAFEATWLKYPKNKRIGKSNGLEYLKKNVNSEDELREFCLVADNYLKSDSVKKGYALHAERFFRDWRKYKEVEIKENKVNDEFDEFFKG